MSCVLSTGFNKECRDSIGGVKEYFIAKYSEVDIENATIDSDGIITALSPVTADADPFHKYSLRKQTGGVASSSEGAEENASFVFVEEITIPLFKREQVKRNEIKALAAIDALIIEKDQNGKYWLHGKENGATLDSLSGGSGVAYADKSGWDLVFKTMEPAPPTEIQYAAFSDMIAAIA